MRQVPKIKYLFIGSGQLAKHLSFYFKQLHIDFEVWQRSKNTISELEQMAIKSSHIVFLTKDSAIEKFYQDYQSYFKNKICFHCSGSLVVKGLQSAHPLMTFTKSLYPLETYKNIVFTLENNKTSFEKIFPRLQNKHNYIASEKKSLYHSYLVMSGNFTSILWKTILKDLQHDFNISKEDAQPYLNQIFQNIKFDPDSAPSGPLVRGDSHTMMSHLSTLTHTNYYDLYKAFSIFYEKSQIDDNEANWAKFEKEHLNPLN